MRACARVCMCVCACVHACVHVHACGCGCGCAGVRHKCGWYTIVCMCPHMLPLCLMMLIVYSTCAYFCEFK